MATREEKTSNITYLVVKHHSIAEESKTPREGFEEVIVQNPKTKEQITKYIDKWGAVTGFITKIEPYDTKDTYETRFVGFKLHIDDDCILDLPHKTPAYDAFCKTAENIDFSQPVTLSAYHNRAKDRTGFNVKQNGENVPWKYTMDNMGDCPPWEKDEEGEWDSRKQRAFLKAKVNDVVIPMCDAANQARIDSGVQTAPKAKAASAGSTGTEPREGDLTDEDIPF